MYLNNVVSMNGGTSMKAGNVLKLSRVGQERTNGITPYKVELKSQISVRDLMELIIHNSPELGYIGTITIGQNGACKYITYNHGSFSKIESNILEKNIIMMKASGQCERMNYFLKV